MLRLAQGVTDAAVAGIRRALDEAVDRMARARLLPSFVEIMIGAGDVEQARKGVEELSAISALLEAPLLSVVTVHARGAVLLAEGDARAALPELRDAWRGWRGLEVPYEAARVRVLLGSACKELGDSDSATVEFDAARSVFAELTAAPDLARVDRLAGADIPRPAGGLTAREMQVLALVAAGKSNRTIAADLFLSEHTIARHVQNILRKLDVPSRAAAVAYAFDHDLL